MQAVLDAAVQAGEAADEQPQADRVLPARCETNDEVTGDPITLSSGSTAREPAVLTRIQAAVCSQLIEDCRGDAAPHA